MASVRLTAFIVEGRPAIARKNNSSKVDQELCERHARSSVGEVQLPSERSTGDPDEVDSRLDGVDFVERGGRDVEVRTLHLSCLWANCLGASVRLVARFPRQAFLVDC